jgi:hypothetical protein
LSLDLARIAPQIEEMAARMKAGGSERRQHIQAALDVIKSPAANLDALKQKVARSKTTFLVAEPIEKLNSHSQPPTPPPDFTVLATDGSHIDIDRHRSARCFLINIGRVSLSYGAKPDAALDAVPRLYFDESELSISSDNGRRQPIEGVLLGIKRGVEECRELSAMAAALPADSAALALLDGSLILWGLASKDYPEFIVDVLLDKAFLKYLEDIRTANRRMRVPLASYISFPRSTDVVNTLRVAICPHEAPDCDRYCNETPTGKRPCDVLADVQDRDIFTALLGEGERSALFASQSQIVKKHYGGHAVLFFYLRAGDEIARIELPQWSALDDERLCLAHSLILDQCRRGLGYPAALSEAHEQAVLSGADRENFQRLVDILMAEEDMAVAESQKCQSKRTRWI